MNNNSSKSIIDAIIAEQLKNSLSSTAAKSSDPTSLLVQAILNDRLGSVAEDDDISTTDTRIVEGDYEYAEEPRPDVVEFGELHELRSTLVRMQTQMEDMFEELSELTHRNDMFASMFGACGRCWGEDPDCAECQGQGFSGTYEPDKELLKRFATPALRRLRN